MNADQLAAPGTSPSALIADVATRLAKGDDLVANAGEVLGTLREALGADECSLWLHRAEGLECAARAGTASVGVTEVTDALDRIDTVESESIIVRPLDVGVRPFGALVAVLSGPWTLEQEVLFSTLASLLAAALGHAEQIRQLNTELEFRARQIDDQRKLTERIIDSLPVGLYVIDREYRVQVWNRNRETGLQGVSREKALGQTIFEILHRQPAEALKIEFDEVFRTGRIQQFNIESKGSGEPRTYRITKVPMRLTDGEISHVISIGEDVTDWTNAQERFAQSEKLAAIGQLAAGVMHEVNNPLATIAACAESLELRLGDMREQGVSVPAQADEFLKIIDGEVHRCKAIVDRLLDFSRPQVATLERVDVNEVLERTLFLLKHHVSFRKIKVRTMMDPSLAAVSANGDQLIQVFMALLINAADAMNATGSITIRTRLGPSRNEAVIAEIIDEGSGIPRSDLAKIFEPFYTTKPPGRGTGLGLSICYGIVTEHGGRIEVDSAVSAGSTFRVLLPSHVDHA
ncbi:MAG: ATP-binding protein [Gemmatimonadaceae bacterium]